MRNTAPTSTLERLNPLLCIEDDFMISVHGDYTAGFKVSLPEIFTLTEEEYWEVHGSWVKAIRGLPDYSVFHKMDVYTQAHYRPPFKEDEPSFLTRASQMHFAGRPYLQHTCYVFLTKTSPMNARKSTRLTTLCRGKIIPNGILDNSVFEEFREAVMRFQAILEASGLIRLEPLTEHDYIGDKDEAGLLDRYFNFFEESPAVADLELLPDRIVAGDRHACVYSLADVDSLPQTLAPSSINATLSTDRTACHMSSVAPLCQHLGHDHIYNQYLFLDSAAEMEDKLTRQSKHMTSLSKLSRENEVNARLIEEYIGLIHEAAMRPCRAHFNVIAWGKERDFDRIRNDVAAALSLIDCIPRQVTVDAPVFYWAGIPGNGADFPVEDTFIQFVESVTCLFNEETSYVSSDSSFGIRLCDRFTHIPLHVDISDEPMKKGWTTNRNKFILGPSGSGKSFFTNSMLRQYWEQGSDVLIVDVGDSYLGLCQWIQQKTHGKDGVYYTYTEEHPIAFNPFYTDDRQFDINKEKTITTLLLTLWKKEGEFISRSEETAVKTAVHLYIQKIVGDPDLQPSFNDFYEWLQTEYQAELSVQNVRDKEFDLDNFLMVLNPYYQGGQYDYLLNATDNLDLLNKRFVVFELDKIKDDEILFPVVTVIIMEAFLNKMYRLKGVRKVILIEEAWKAIAKSGMADFIKYLFKTVRKHFGEAVVVTQEVDDILSSPVVKESIINNSDCKILLDQRKYMNKFDGIQAVLGLTDKQKAQVLSINRDLDPRLKYREVYIDLNGQHSGVYATEVSTEEYLIYTTEQTEKMEFFETAERYGGDIELAARALASK